LEVPPPKLIVIQSTVDTADRMQLDGFPVAAKSPTPPLAAKDLPVAFSDTLVHA
jgi:hypothetical protein